MSFKPPLRYRITGALNVVIWRLPLPRRIIARLSTTVYRNPPTPGELVVRVLGALDDAGVSCWIRGGWGTDALVGRQTRAHHDLDLVVDSQMTEHAVEALEKLGFREWYRVDSDTPLCSRVVMSDHELAGRAVDLQPFDVSSDYVRFATGAIDRHTVPCLAVESQLAFHSEYRLRRRDRHDAALLESLIVERSAESEPAGTSSGGHGEAIVVSERVVQASDSTIDAPPISQRIMRRLIRGSSTVLIVPVNQIDDLRHANALEAGMPAHVTVLYPFVRAREVDRHAKEMLGAALGAIPAFDFTMSEIRRFPNVVYLAPDPAEPFVALTHAVLRHWPDQQPYDGAFEEIVPHVTVAYGESTPSGVVEHLPITARAQEVWLMTRQGNRWVLRERFELGAPSGPPKL